MIFRKAAGRKNCRRNCYCHLRRLQQ